MHIAICEDLKKDSEELRRMLETYVKRHQLDAEISCFSCGEALLEQCRPGRYHILFLDVFLGGISGMEVAQRVRQIDGEVAIIFVTVSREYAADSYLVDAAFYLVKPLDEAALSQGMERCRHLIQQHAKSVTVAESRHLVQVRLGDILYLESQRNDCILHTDGGEIRTRAKLSELEGELGGWPFVRCHRSFIVNLHWLEDMLERDFLLHGGVRVPISRAYSAQAQQAFQSFLLSSARGGEIPLFNRHRMC